LTDSAAVSGSTSAVEGGKKKRGPKGSKKAKTMRERLRMADGGIEGEE
jgi:hypothetical protein